MSIVIENASVEIDGVRTLDSISTSFDEGVVTGVLGPNGAGKSTLLRLAAGIERPLSGRVSLDGTELRELGRRAVAQQIALLEQSAAPALDLTVTDVVLLGRIPHRRGMFGGFDTPDDRAIAHDALQSVGALEFAARPWHSLSGGEQQRVHIARALAQVPSVLVLDEPTNHLDVSAQLSVLAQVRRLELTSVVALHDLNLASAYCDRLVMLSGGRLVAEGTPQQVLTPELIQRVYGTACDVIAHPRHGNPLVVYAMDGAAVPVPADSAAEASVRPAASPAA